MSIHIMGDIHGLFAKFERIATLISPEDTIIQVGDFGFYPNVINTWNRTFPNGYPCRVLAIEGNHEDFNYLRQFKGQGIAEVSTNLFYVNRGEVLEIEGQLFGFLGGAESVDRYWSEPNVSWWPDERVEHSDVDRLIENVNGRQLDCLITHAPPASIILEAFPKLDKESWNLPRDWEDVSSMRIQRAMAMLKPHKLFCGHMHRSVRVMGGTSVIILDINEVVTL